MEFSPLATVLRAYAFAYTAMHDFSVSDRVMADEYVLRMGPIELRGREREYQPATQRQYRQFPGLGFTVHRFVSNGDRAAFHFSEHGRSVLHEAEATWQGISLYRWDGRVLTECRVEQDYFARRRQLSEGVPSEVPPPARDPWTGPDRPACGDIENIIRSWLADSSWRDDPSVAHDDGSEKVRIDDAQTEVLDLFGAGDTVAFHVRTTGLYAGGLESGDCTMGTPVDLYATGIVDVAETGPIGGAVVTDRLSMLKRLNGNG